MVENPPGARRIRWHLQRPSNRRMDYHYGNDRCVLQVEPITQTVLKTMLQWICRQHMSGQRTGVAKLIQELEERAV